MSNTQKLSAFQLLWHLISCAPKLYLLDTIFWILIEGFFPAMPGLIIREFFNSLTHSASFGLSGWAFIALFLATGIGHIVAIYLGRLTKTQHRFTVSSLLRRNFLACLFSRPGAEPLVIARKANPTVSPGEVISYFRDDTAQIEDTVAGVNELGSAGLFALGAVVILLSVNAQMTLLIFLPLLGIVGLVRWAQWRIQQYRQASRQATQQVTGLIAELLSSVQAIQLAGAKSHVINHFDQLSDRRRQLMVKDQLLNTLLNSSFGTTLNIGMGLILLLVALSNPASGASLKVGDFALFFYYLAFVTNFLGFLGGFLALSKQTEISFDRMADLVKTAAIPASEPVDSRLVLVAPQQLYLANLWGQTPELPPIPQPQRHPQDSLQTLNVTNLSYRYPQSDRGIFNLTFTLERGSFVVITGPVGAGKTTLLRLLLGLLPRQSGAIYWNSQLVQDPANFFVPPRSAYTPQVPKLFSSSLKANILLGMDENAVSWESAIAQAVLGPDLATMPEGLETLIGSKGVRLSGGQLQRVAAARMFIRQPDLLVFDDLSSALDLKTEQTLWKNLFQLRQRTASPDQQPGESQTFPIPSQPWTPTCLVVSHRPKVLQQADHIILLSKGRIKTQGKLSQLRHTGPDIQML